jgi:lambda repressor-like predicted transcriptional regulator
LNNICITDTISIETTDPYGSLHRKIKEEMTKIKKANQKLPFYITSLLNSAKPADRDNIIRSLSNNGWTLSAISRSVELSRERVRQICETPIDGPMPPDFTNPTPPMYPAKVEREFVEPSPEILARLLELKPMAMQVRSHATRFRAEAEEYTQLIAKAHLEDGVTLYRLAKRMGVTHSALRFRLARYGYKTSEKGQSRVYTPINPKNRHSR